MSITVDSPTAAPQNPTAAVRLPARRLGLRRSAANPRASLSAIERERGVCLDLEAATMSVVVAGAGLFGAGLLRYGVADNAWTGDGVRALQSIAIAAAAFAIVSVVSGLVGLARLVGHPDR